MIRLRYAVVGLSWLLGAGCVDQGSRAAPASSPGRIWLADSSLVRDLRIPGDSLDLVPIGWVAVAPNGSIAFSQDQDRAIRFFDSTGAPQGSFGRNGQGPGEFRRVNRSGWIHDTLWVYDFQLQRITLISPGRTLVRIVPLSNLFPAPADSARWPTYRFVYPRALYADGSLLATADIAVGTRVPAGYDPKRTPLLRASLDGVIRTQLAWMPNTGGSIEFTSADGSGFVAIPFFAEPLEHFAPDGSRIAFALTSVDGPAAGTFLVTVLNDRGETVLNRRHTFVGEPIPRQVADSVLAARIESAPYPEMKRALSQAKIPAVYPPLASLLLGRDSTVWVRLRRTKDGLPWIVLDAKGEIMDTVIVPTNVTVAAAERGRVWAIESDSNDVESVVRYRVKRRP